MAGTAIRQRTFAVVSPATGDVVGECPNQGRDETASAIDAAAAALPAWAAAGSEERGAVLLGAAARLEERGEDLARTIALEGGKPIAEARGEVGYAAGFLRFYAEEAGVRPGRGIPRHPEGKTGANPSATRRRLRADHDLELPGGGDHPAARGRPRRRLHSGRQAGRADAVVGDRGAGRAARSRAFRPAWRRW